LEKVVTNYRVLIITIEESKELLKLDYASFKQSTYLAEELVESTTIAKEVLFHLPKN
jgi:hypothetical protein